MSIFDLNTRDPFCLILDIKMFDVLATSTAGDGPGCDRWSSILCTSTPDCALDPAEYDPFVASMRGLISAYRALCGGFDRHAIAAVFDAVARQIGDQVERCVALAPECLCPRHRRLDRAKAFAHILIDVAWARGVTLPGALSDQCGTVVRLLLAGSYEPQI